VLRVITNINICIYIFIYLFIYVFVIDTPTELLHVKSIYCVPHSHCCR